MISAYWTHIFWPNQFDLIAELDLAHSKSKHKNRIWFTKPIDFSIIFASRSPPAFITLNGLANLCTKLNDIEYCSSSSPYNQQIAIVVLLFFLFAVFTVCLCKHISKVGDEQTPRGIYFLETKQNKWMCFYRVCLERFGWFGDLHL